MSSWTTYKGLDVPDSTTGDAGTKLNSDLELLADGAPHCSASSDPSTSDDSSSTKGYFPGSLWLNKSTRVMWVCVDATVGAAKWRSFYKRIDNAIVLMPDAGVGGGSDARAVQLDTGGNARGTGAVDFQTSRTANSQVASGLYAFIAAGRHNTASGSMSHVEGELNTASNYNAHAEGFHNLSNGNCSHAEGQYCTSSNYGSHAEGVVCNATGHGSHAEGAVTTASGAEAHSEGSYNAATGDQSHVEGHRSYATAGYSHAGGFQSTSHLSGQWARAAGGISSQVASAQTTVTQLCRRTTDATATELTLGGGTPSSSTRFRILDYQTLSCIINIVGRKESGGANDHASFLRQVLIRRLSTTTQLVGSVQTVGVDINPANWGSGTPIAITADDTNDSLKIAVTGAASTNIRWMATVLASEVADTTP